MTRYYLEVRYRVASVDAVDEHTDAMMDALSGESDLIDADVGADLRHGWVDVCAVVEGEDEDSALHRGLVAIRSAAHRTDTPGWGTDLNKVMASVRPTELTVAAVPTQSAGYPSESLPVSDGSQNLRRRMKMSTNAKVSAFVSIEEARTIGARARMIRRRRGLSLDVVAGLAGITAQYLSMLERGQRGFNRRGLLEDLAAALGCSVADLTGQPYLPMDRETAAVIPAISEISLALHNATLDDVPDLGARPLPELVEAAARANMHRDNARYAMAGQGLGAVLTELHVWAVIGSGVERQAALAALAEACQVAYLMARRTGRTELAMMVAERGYEAARRAERPDLAGLMAMNRSGGLMGLGARWRAASVCAQAIGEVSALPGPTPEDTRIAEAHGMLLLTAGLVAARDGRPEDTTAYLAEARDLAAHTGERNHMRFHFGPANVAAWELSLAVESGAGPDAAERFITTPIDFSVFASKEREADVTFDLSRAWAQADGVRDGEALRALDTADRLAPLRVRNDPIARDLVLTLDRRARHRVWELDSLCNRFGIRER